jgi:hypothetical protein
MEDSAPWLIAWFAVFSCINAVRIGRRLWTKALPAKDSAGFTELAFVYRRGKFFDLPDDPSLLRNMIYFGRLRV